MHLWKVTTVYNIFVNAEGAAGVERSMATHLEDQEATHEGVGVRIFPVDAFACMLTTPLHSRVVDNVVPRNFLRRWYLQPDMLSVLDQHHTLAAAFGAFHKNSDVEARVRYVFDADN